MKFGKFLVSIYQPGNAAILNSIPGLEVIEDLAISQFVLKKKSSMQKCCLQDIFLSTTFHFQM